MKFQANPEDMNKLSFPKILLFIKKMSASDSPQNSSVFDSMFSLLHKESPSQVSKDTSEANYDFEQDLTLPKMDFKAPNSESLATLEILLPSLDILEKQKGSN